MKKFLAFLTVVSMVLSLLVSCVPAGEDCDHKYNAGGYCTKCEEECPHERVSDRGYCPDCKQSNLPLKSCTANGDKHIDADDNGKCDKCRNVYEDGCDVHIDKDDDGVCDTQECRTEIDDGCDNHRDADDDGFCDITGCGLAFNDGCEEHKDENHDRRCDICSESVPCTHSYNSAGFCVYCTERCPHENATDGYCSDCGACDYHRDANDDGFCDKCEGVFDDGCDANHRDANDDGFCDFGYEPFEDGCDANHKDADDDNRCDFGGEAFADGCDVHRDANDDGRCDKYGCGTEFEDGCDAAHADYNDDGKCDFGGEEFEDGCNVHTDKNDDGFCDVDGCGTEFEDGCDNHEDGDGDDKCDKCNGSLGSCNHVDMNDDGFCDKCNEPYEDGCDANHTDANDDGKCDFGGEAYDDGCDNHRDLDDDNECDTCYTSWWDGCDNHRDADDDGYCDNTYYCSEPYEDGHDYHRDLDDDNECDTCYTSWWDGCDNHRDADDDGMCDYTYYCSEEFWDGCEHHRDANDDGYCDNTYYCSEPFEDGCDADHKDSDDDGKCDFGYEPFEDGCDVHRDADDDGKCDKCQIAYEDGKEGEVTVSIRKSGSGITLGATSMTAQINEPLVIDVSFSEYYRFDKSVPEGVYDKEAGTLTIPSFPSGTTRVTVYSREADEFYFTFEGTDLDSCSIAGGDFYFEDTLVTVKAGDTDRQFAGWSSGKSAANGGKIFSTDRQATFALSKELCTSATNLNIKIYANYIDGNVYYYDANGGSVDTSSVNRTNNAYYTATLTAGRLKVTLGANYYNVIGAVASTFYDDGTFYRDGYILKEYNTKADGSGEGYNLGAKFTIEAVGGVSPTLYCIWEKESAVSDFTYKSVTISRPSGASESTVPYWSEQGIEITSYLGNDKTVVIPEKIDGKYVTSIAAGAFDGKSVEVLVMGRRILRIADGAFKNCFSLTTVYYPDGIAYATDSFMDEATKSSFANLRVNAVMPPKYSANAWAGLFAIKLTRLMSTADTNRLIMIGGSSIYEGVASAYLEALLNEDLENKDYSFINFGTTRTLTIMLYLDAVDYYTKEGDMVIMSPENHARAMGDTSFVANSYDDAEGMYPSLMRHLDIRNFSGVFSSLSQFNLNRASRGATRYEEICKLGGSDAYGDDISDNTRRSLLRNQSGCIAYTDTYVVTFNERIKSSKDAKWDDASAQEASRDWKDKSNETWCSFNDPIYANQVNRMISEVKATGASFYFAFAPVDGTGVEGSTWGVIPECKADPDNWLAAYDKLITDTYDVDGLIGKSSDYIYHHNYFYDNIYHLNNWGRAIRTYQLYLDLCDVLGIVNKVGATSKGTDFAGCKFESDITNPTYTVDWLK